MCSRQIRARAASFSGVVGTDWPKDRSGTEQSVAIRHVVVLQSAGFFGAATTS